MEDILGLGSFSNDSYTESYVYIERLDAKKKWMKFGTEEILTRGNVCFLMGRIAEEIAQDRTDGVDTAYRLTVNKIATETYSTGAIYTK